MTTMLPLLYERPCLIEVMSTDNEKKFVVPKVGTLLRINAADPSGFFIVVSNEVFHEDYINANRDSYRQYWLELYFVDETRIMKFRAEWFEEVLRSWNEV